MILAPAKRLLGQVPFYVALQKGVGADRLRYRCIEELDLQPDEAVLDVGCGPAYYYERLPAGVRYFGFDTDERYIAWATAKWGDKAQFRCEIFTEESLATLPPINAVMFLGLLHHMSDEQCRDLLKLAAKSLAPGGRVVSIDTTFEPTQGAISRWMSRNDRGEYVRTPAEFEKLARESFSTIVGEVVNTATRIPSSHWMMQMSNPA